MITTRKIQVVTRTLEQIWPDLPGFTAAPENYDFFVGTRRTNYDDALEMDMIPKKIVPSTGQMRCVAILLGIPWYMADATVDRESSGCVPKFQEGIANAVLRAHTQQRYYSSKSGNKCVLISARGPSR
jgi:hypothetical protein